MDQDQLRKLLEDVRAGGTEVEAAIERLRHMPYEDLGFAKVDHHRALDPRRHIITHDRITEIGNEQRITRGQDQRWPRLGQVASRRHVHR